MELSREPLEFIVQEKRGNTMTEHAMNPDEPLKENTRGVLRIFVYGILKRGFWNHDRFCRGVLDIREAEVRGRLSENALGYPRPAGPGRECPRLRHSGRLGRRGHIGAPFRTVGLITPYRPCKAPQRATGDACKGNSLPSPTPRHACPPSIAWRVSTRADRACTNASLCLFRPTEPFARFGCIRRQNPP